MASAARNASESRVLRAPGPGHLQSAARTHPGATSEHRHPRPHRAGPARERFVDLLSAEAGKVIVGQRYMIERILIGLLTGGHVLLEGVPGPGQDADRPDPRRQHQRAASSASSSRPTCCPPTWSARMIYNQQTASSPSARARSSPTWCSPTRSTAPPPRCSRALLEAMQERQVTIGDQTYPLPAALPRAGHPEPHRAGGHLPAARGAGRPLHAQGEGRLPHRARRSGRSWTAWRGGEPPAGQPVVAPGAASPRARARRPRRSTSTRR